MIVPKKLPIHMLLSVANAACSKYGLRPVTPKEAQHLYHRNCAPAIIRTDGYITLWADPTYIAVQEGTGIVRYLFLTMAYIDEEYSSYRMASRQRRITVKPPREIDRQLKAAREIMVCLDRFIFFAPFAAELELDWIDTWLKDCYEDAKKISKVKLIREYKETVA